MLQAQSSLPECKGSPYEVKKLSLTGGGLATKMKMLAKWRNCQGTLINKDGSQYIGEFQGGNFLDKELLHGETENLLETNMLENF